MKSFNLLEKMLPPEEKIFYEYFETGAKLCNESALMLEKLIQTGISSEKIAEVRRIRQEINALSKKALQHLNSTFITPLDREDIQFIISRLNRINKRITKSCMNFKIYKLEAYSHKLEEQVKCLVKATGKLKILLSNLKKVSKVKEIIECTQLIKEVENHGDELYIRDLEELFSGQYDALTVIKLKDIYNSIESALNTCSSVSDEVVTIVFKHS